MEIAPKMATKEVATGNGRDSDELHRTVYDKVKYQDGWIITAKEVIFDWSEKEIIFTEKSAEIISAASSIELFGGCKVKVVFPSYSEMSVTLNNSKVGEIFQVDSQDEELYAEKFFAFINKRDQVSFARAAMLSAPIKENRRGLSIRSYLTSMDSDNLQKDEEFYSSLLEELGLI